MANDYYTAPAAKQPLEIIRSSEYNTNNLATEAGFDKLPAQSQLNRSQYGNDTSTVATLYKITVPVLDVAYYEGLTVVFEAVLANTGTANIQINGGVIKELVDSGGTPLVVGNIFTGQIVTATYTSNLKFQIQFAADSATSAAIASTAATEALSSETTASAALTEVQRIAALQDEVSLHFYRNS